MSMYDNEIDLRPYIFALIRSWWLIASLAVIAAVTVFFISRLQPSYYEATATLLLSQSRSRLALADQFPTTSDAANPAARIQTLLSLIKSENFSQQTLQILENEHPEKSVELRSANERVSITTEGDLLRVTSQASDPNIAVEVANTWARQAIQTINQAYTEELPLLEIQNQLANAEEVYLADQSKLEQFLQENQTRLVETQLAEAKQLLNRLASERASRLEFYIQRKLTMEELAVQAESLNQQLETSSTSIAGGLGDALAVLKARADMFGIIRNNQTYSARPSQVQNDSEIQPTGEKPPMTSSYSPAVISPSEGLALNIQIPATEELTTDREAFAADVEALIQQARNEQARAEEEIQNLSSEMIGEQPSQGVEYAARRVQELDALLEQGKARELELTSQRDLSWKAFQALAQKEAELANGIQASSFANLAIPALPADEPSGSQTVLNAGIAAILGLMIGILWVISSTWWKRLTAGSSQKLSISASDGSD